MKSIKDLLEEKKAAGKKPGYVTREFQDYGYRLALSLDDVAHKSLYIKLAKDEDRQLLQQARDFAIDYPDAKNKGKIIMWKLNEMKREMKR